MPLSLGCLHGPCLSECQGSWNHAHRLGRGEWERLSWLKGRSFIQPSPECPFALLWVGSVQTQRPLALPASGLQSAVWCRRQSFTIFTLCSLHLCQLIYSQGFRILHKSPRLNIFKFPTHPLTREKNKCCTWFSFPEFLFLLNGFTIQLVIQWERWETSWIPLSHSWLPIYRQVLLILLPKVYQIYLTPFSQTQAFIIF